MRCCCALPRLLTLTTPLIERAVMAIITGRCVTQSSPCFPSVKYKKGCSVRGGITRVQNSATHHGYTHAPNTCWSAGICAHGRLAVPAPRSESSSGSALLPWPSRSAAPMHSVDNAAPEREGSSLSGSSLSVCSPACLSCVLLAESGRCTCVSHSSACSGRSHRFYSRGWPTHRYAGCRRRPAAAVSASDYPSSVQVSSSASLRWLLV